MMPVAEHFYLRPVALEELWNEAESIGNVKVYPKGTGWEDADPRKSYEVTITGRKGHAVIAVKREHQSFACALADAVNEARELGLGREADDLTRSTHARSMAREMPV